MNGWRKIVVRVLCTIFPDGERVPGLDPRRMARFLDTFLAESPPLLRLALHGSALAYLLSTPLTVGRLTPALWLGPRARDRHAQGVATHPLYLLRQAMLMLKTVGGLCWGADPTVRSRLGLAPYPPDPGSRRER